MSLPIRTTLADIDAVCGYLVTKPTGATLAEMKAVVDRRSLDGRKLTSLKFWGFIEDHTNGKTRITDRGRLVVRDSGSSRSQALGEVIRQVKPYSALVERVVHSRQETMAATDVAAHWYEHFSDDVAGSDKTLNDQAVCFFQVAQGADLGTLTRGRRGMPTRFDFDIDATRLFLDRSPTELEEDVPIVESTQVGDLVAEDSEPITEEDTDFKLPKMADSTTDNNRVFITHGENSKILRQVKELVEYGKYEPVVAMEHETAAKPVPQKVMDDMRKCKAAVIHVSAERVLYDDGGNEIPQINRNVLIEIGAAMALYGDRFVLLVEEGLELPSNLQGLYECRYKGDELNMTAVMKLLKAFNEF